MKFECWCQKSEIIHGKWANCSMTFEVKFLKAKRAYQRENSKETTPTPKKKAKNKRQKKHRTKKNAKQKSKKTQKNKKTQKKAKKRKKRKKKEQKKSKDTFPKRTKKQNKAKKSKKEIIFSQFWLSILLFNCSKKSQKKAKKSKKEIIFPGKISQIGNSHDWRLVSRSVNWSTDEPENVGIQAVDESV